MSNVSLSHAYRQEQSTLWQQAYLIHLRQRLLATQNYLQTTPIEELRTHSGSFLNLINEACRYPDLDRETLALITLLHPWPLRWGLGHLWETHLRYAIEHIQNEKERSIYQIDLAESHIALGKFDSAMLSAQAVLQTEDAPHLQKARACRILFRGYQSTGNPEKALQMIERYSAYFEAETPASQILPGYAGGWLRFNQCRLEWLRIQGKHSQALALIEEMVWLDEHLGQEDSALTADLITDRSTLLWSDGQYLKSANDLLFAIELYERMGDHFNAQALQSNLGLVYWTMGELDKAEAALQSAIQFYRRSGSEQLLTYDLGNMGLVYFSRGDLVSAKRWTEDHIQHAHKLDFNSEYQRGRHNLGTILYFMGAHEASLAEIEYVQPYRIKHGRRESHGLDELYIALIKSKLGQHTWAREKTREIVDWANAQQLRVLEQIALRCLAYLSPLSEKADYLYRSLDLARSQHRKLEEAACLLMLAQTLTVVEEQIKTWHAGVSILEEVGAQAWLADHDLHRPPFLLLSL